MVGLSLRTKLGGRVNIMKNQRLLLLLCACAFLDWFVDRIANKPYELKASTTRTNKQPKEKTNDRKVDHEKKEQKNT